MLVLTHGSLGTVCHSDSHYHEKLLVILKEFLKDCCTSMPIYFTRGMATLGQSNSIAALKGYVGVTKIDTNMHASSLSDYFHSQTHYFQIFLDSVSRNLSFLFWINKYIKYLRFYIAICYCFSCLLNWNMPFSLFLLLILIYIWNWFLHLLFLASFPWFYVIFLLILLMYTVL